MKRKVATEETDAVERRFGPNDDNGEKRASVRNPMDLA
jgi:hypothetical protein